MVLDNVPRIAAPSLDAFRDRYLYGGEPVILTDLFDEAPLRSIDTLDRARHALGDVVLEIQPNYLTFLETGRPGERRPMRLGRYLEHARANPGTRDLCVEFPTPEALRRLLPPPRYADIEDPGDVVSATFLANAGNYNHLHFDDDHRGVLLYQVFGTKRFTVISPRQGRKLDAFLTFDPVLRQALARTPARDANGRVYLQTFPNEPAREQFLRYADARDCILRPGETLFMPALAWHYVEYCETALSVTYRLGRNPWNRGLSEAFPMPTVLLQEVGSTLVDAARFSREHQELAAELDALLPARSAEDRRALERFVERAFERLSGERASAVVAARELHRAALAV